MAIELAAEPRTETGKEKCLKLRAANRLPGNIYGGSLKEPHAISLDLHATEQVIKTHGAHADYVVVLEGQRYPVRIQEVRFDPVKRGYLHIDFVVAGDGG